MNAEVDDLSAAIDALWLEARTTTPMPSGLPGPVEKVLSLLDDGTIRVAEKRDGRWATNEWIRRALLLSFRFSSTRIVLGGPQPGFDKVPLKFMNAQESDFRRLGLRIAPGAIVRRSAHLEPGVVLMPSFVNIGARIGANTMVDTWASVGSCAQIGANVHLSGGVGIGGVLEPVQSGPTIIEDGCFIGARSEVVEGVLVEQGSVLSMGVFLSQSTKIVDRQTGLITYGRIPPYSVVVPGSLPTQPSSSGEANPSLACAVIVKTVDAMTRSKTSINQLLRE